MKVREQFLYLTEHILSAGVVASAVFAAMVHDSSPFRGAYIILALAYGVVLFVAGLRHYRLWNFLCMEEEKLEREKTEGKSGSEAERIVDLMCKIEHDQRLIEDARNSLISAEKELDEILIGSFGEEAEVAKEEILKNIDDARRKG